MLEFIIFLSTNMLVLFTFKCVYGAKPKYQNGMLLGVHIPVYGVHDPEIEALMEKHQKNIKSFYALNFVAALGISFLVFWYMSIFIIVWGLWLAELIALARGLQFGVHRKLYDLKMRRNWQGAAGSNIIAVDTRVAATGGRLSRPIWWHVPVIIGEMAPVVFPSIRRSLLKPPHILFLYGCVGALTILFIVLHLWTVRRRNEVLSSDTNINKRINQLDKKVWSMIWIICDYMNFLSLCFIVLPILTRGWFMGLDFAGFVTAQTLTGFLIFFVLLYLKWKKGDILKDDIHPLYIDDDVYWKNGWYNNPGDKRLLVQDRFCSLNHSCNMGHTSIKIFIFGTLGAVLILFMVLAGQFLKMDFSPLHLFLDGENVKISAPLYPLTFRSEDIKGLELLDKIPTGNFVKTNGLADNRQLVGKFSNQGQDFRVYLYRKYSPILKIELPAYTVLINSREKNQTEKWYKELLKNASLSIKGSAGK